MQERAPNRKKVVIVGAVHAAGMRLLEARDDIDFEVIEDGSEANLIERLKDADGVTLRAAKMTARVIAAAERLRVVSRHGVGYDSVDVPALSARGIPLAIAINCNAVSVAEQAFAYLMALAKRMMRFDAGTRAGEWAVLRRSFDQFDLAGRTLLVIGYGRIGRQIVRRALAFDMRVLVADPYVEAAEIAASGAEPVADFRSVLGEIDAVTVHTPLTPETRSLIGAPELRAMKRSAFVINCARGGIVDEPALAEALKAGTVAGAGIDVFDPEPPPPDHPLLNVDNAILSPHSAGVTIEAAIRAATESVQNVLDAFDGRLDPAAVVNREVLG